MKGIVSTMLQRLLQEPQDAKEKLYTLSEVAEHCHCNDCWVIICDHVYDVTSFLDQHPGGRDVLMEHAGRDATIAFYSSGHHPNTMELLRPFRVGILAPFVDGLLLDFGGKSSRKYMTWAIVFTHEEFQHERVNLIGSLNPRDNAQTICS